MRKQGVTRLIAYCLNDACRHQATIEVWSYPADTEIAYFKRRVVCAKCGARGNKLATPAGPARVGLFSCRNRWLYLTIYFRVLRLP